MALTTLSIDGLTITHLGLIEYETALEMQRDLHQRVVAGEAPHTLLLLEHPSIYTAGKRTLDDERPRNGSRVIDVDRGGKITWHGPGQLVGYPIIALREPHELVGFVRTLEGALIAICKELGISTQRIEGRSGVWVVDDAGARKIAAIGIRIAQGVSMHGFALNVNPDLSPFEEIIPCGISDAAVTSLSKESGREIEIAEITEVVERHMALAIKEVAR